MAILACFLAALLCGSYAHAGEPPRFFVAGTGRLAVVNGHTDEAVDVRYRLRDNSYDGKALARLRHALRSNGDAREAPIPVRLFEVLSRLQQLAGGKPLIIVSGYRSPEYNESIRAKGAKAAAGSLHTEGLAADVALPRPSLFGLWKQVRALDCCGAGYYAKEGFLHVDVGRPRFWEAATSRVDENLSASNARLFSRTEFDRYRIGEDVMVTLHSLTVPPVMVARAGRLVADAGGTTPLTVSDGTERSGGGCITIGTTGAAVRVRGLTSAARGRVVLETCEPRLGATPEKVESNPIEVR